MINVISTASYVIHYMSPTTGMLFPQLVEVVSAIGILYAYHDKVGNVKMLINTDGTFLDTDVNEKLYRRLTIVFKTDPNWKYMLSNKAINATLYNLVVKKGMLGTGVRLIDSTSKIFDDSKPCTRRNIARMVVKNWKNSLRLRFLTLLQNYLTKTNNTIFGLYYYGSLTPDNCWEIANTILNENMIDLNNFRSNYE